MTVTRIGVPSFGAVSIGCQPDPECFGTMALLLNGWKRRSPLLHLSSSTSSFSEPKRSLLCPPGPDAGRKKQQSCAPLCLHKDLFGDSWHSKYQIRHHSR